MPIPQSTEPHKPHVALVYTTYTGKGEWMVFRKASPFSQFTPEQCAAYSKANEYAHQRNKNERRLRGVILSGCHG